MLDGLKGQLPKNGARQVGQDVAKTMISEREQPGDPMPDCLDLKALTGYACVSERTLASGFTGIAIRCRPRAWERSC
jgi:hypothetical protein